MHFFAMFHTVMSKIEMFRHSAPSICCVCCRLKNFLYPGLQAFLTPQYSHGYSVGFLLTLCPYKFTKVV